MTAATPATEQIMEWQQEILAREEQGRVAFLTADVEALDQLWADELVVNSPLNRLNNKREVLELLRLGRIRHREFAVEIEHVSRHGDLVVVMGNDTVLEPPAGVRSYRRFTNIWQLRDGAWRMLARHAHVVRTEPVG